MKAIEFVTELGGPALALPPGVADRLPPGGRARVIVLVDDGADEEEAAWQLGAYEQFMRDDDPEDAIYDQFA